MLPNRTVCVRKIRILRHQGACGLVQRSTEKITQKFKQVENFWEMLFPAIMMGDDRAVRSV